MAPAPDDMPTCGDWAPSGLNGRLRESREGQRPNKDTRLKEKNSPGPTNDSKRKNKELEKLVVKF